MRRQSRIVVALACTLLVTTPVVAQAEPGSPVGPGNPTVGPTTPTGPGEVGPDQRPGEVGPDGEAVEGELVTGAPTQQQVDDARAAVAAATADVATLRGAVAEAAAQAQQAAVDATAAGEVYRRARRHADRLTAAAEESRATSDAAGAVVDAQRDAYVDTITSGYVTAPGLGALGALAGADGITEVVEDTVTLRNAEIALESRYADFVVSSSLAEVATAIADASAEKAQRAQRKAERGREAAEAMVAFAAEQTRAVAAQRDALVAVLADLQDTSTALAERRQQALEVADTREATRAAIRKARKNGETKKFDDPEGPQWGDPITVTTYVPLGPLPVIPDGPPPRPGRGAKAAIAFARAQIGEPYVWAAAGPEAWDCSGLTMGAWAHGGKALPHYSVAQYAQSTPIQPTDLKPGDLVFWGRTNDPASIYHVALYTGDGMIIQAPRSGVPVQETSMFAWVPPNFHARP